MPGIKISQAKSTGESVGGATGEAAAREGEVRDSEVSAAALGKVAGKGTMDDQQKQHVGCFSTVVRRQYLHKSCTAQELSMGALHKRQQTEVVGETT